MSGLSSEKACNSTAYPYALLSESTQKKKKKKMSAFKRVNAIISRKASKSGETLPHTQTADTKLTPRCD